MSTVATAMPHATAVLEPPRSAGSSASGTGTPAAETGRGGESLIGGGGRRERHDLVHEVEALVPVRDEQDGAVAGRCEDVRGEPAGGLRVEDARSARRA